MPPFSLSDRTRLLIVAPHPDDETLGCGVLLQQVLAAGGAVRLLLMTDGDNNPWPQRYLERRVILDEVARRHWGARRRSEVLDAIHRLGAPTSILHPLGWRDMEITERLRTDLAGSLATMQSAINAFEPDLICCPALLDTHPDHGAAHVLCHLALAGEKAKPTLLAYPMHGLALPATYPLVLEGTAEQQRSKLDAMAMHKSQMALSGRRMRRLAGMPERYQCVDMAVQGGDLPWWPPIVLRRWLRLLVVDASGSYEWPWQEAPISRRAEGGYRLERSMLCKGRDGPAFAKLYLPWRSPWIFDHWGWCAL